MYFLELFYTQIGSYKIETTKEKKKINLKFSWLKMQIFIVSSQALMP